MQADYDRHIRKGTWVIVQTFQTEYRLQGRHAFWHHEAIAIEKHKWYLLRIFPVSKNKKNTFNYEPEEQ